MKKILSVLVLLFLSFAIFGCEKGIYKVCFYDYDGTFIEGYYYFKGEEVVLPTAEPKRNGYDFVGWDKTVEMIVTKDADYIAVYKERDKTASDELSFHFIDVQNSNNGDAIYIKAGETDILIDAGSTKSSSRAIENYIDQYCTDRKLEFAICTHGDEDHIAGFVGTSTNPGIFEYYDIDIIIDNPLTNKTTVLYKNYQEKRDNAKDRGAKHYTALECYQEKNGASRTYSLGNGLEMEILYNYYYENSTSDENDYSVCVLFKDIFNEKYFLFTGDLEKSGEKKLVQNYNLPEVELFKAGHHGSPTSSNDELLSVIKPKICVVSCVAGKNEYTQNIDNIFPSTAFINRIAKYTDNVYVTAMVSDGNYAPLNGTVIVKCDNGLISVNCLNNNTILKDSDWFNSSVEYYSTDKGDFLPDSKNPSTGTRTWRTWPTYE